MKWQQLPVDRGTMWIARDGEAIAGCIAYSYLPSNDGSLFASNYGKGHVSITVRDASEGVLAQASLRASSRNEADSLVRAWVRTNGARALIESAYTGKVNAK